MSTHVLFGSPNKSYDTRSGIYRTDFNGLLTTTSDADAAELIAQGMTEQTTGEPYAPGGAGTGVYSTLGATLMATFGHSWTKFCDNVPAVAQASVSWMDGKAPIAIAQVLASGAVFCPYELQFSVSGEKTDATLARIETAIATMKAYGCRSVTIINGTNDRDGIHNADFTNSNMAAMFQRCKDEGFTTFAVTDIPRGGGPTPATNRLSGTLLEEAMACHRWYYQVAQPTYGIVPIDAFAAMGSATSVLGEARSGMLLEGLHCNQNGAYALGARIAAAWKKVFGVPVFGGYSARGNLFSAGNPRGNWFSNSTLGGTTGSNPGSTGTSPDWTITARNAAFNAGASMISLGAPVAGTGKDAGIVWHQFTITGNSAANAGPRYEIQFPMRDNSGVSLLGNLGLGSRIRASCRVEVEGGAVGLKGLDYGSLFFDNATAYEGRSATVYTGAGAAAIEVPAGGWKGDDALWFMPQDIVLPAPSGGAYLTGRGVLRVDVMESVTGLNIVGRVGVPDIWRVS